MGGAMINHGTAPCISFGSLRVDQAVSAEVLRFLQPLGIEAAIRAIEARDAETDEKCRQTQLALKQARFESTHARRQYDAVECPPSRPPLPSSAPDHRRLPAIPAISPVIRARPPPLAHHPAPTPPPSHHQPQPHFHPTHHLFRPPLLTTPYPRYCV